MSFPGIVSSLAGAEPGRSGFPASYTSLLDYPPAQGSGGLLPLSGGETDLSALTPREAMNDLLGRRRSHLPSAVLSSAVKAAVPTATALPLAMQLRPLNLPRPRRVSRDHCPQTGPGCVSLARAGASFWVGVKAWH